MSTKDVKVDAYIKKAEPFAQPILTHLRELVHKSCQEVEEVIKWSFPCFVYKKSILCSMASFKKHCAFGFWLQSKMEDPDGILVDRDKEVAMGSMGRITSVKELPSSKILSKYIKQAMNLIEAGVKITKTATPKEKKELQVPVELEFQLKKNKAARETFNAFSYSHKFEYIEWITEAKTEPTKLKRIAETIKMLSEGNQGTGNIRRNK